MSIKPCEYCGADLPLGVDKHTRRIRSAHFSNCPCRPVNDPPVSEIDELRAALLERDAQTEVLANELQGAGMQIDAQRKVLEQALEALQSLFSFKVDDTRGERCSAAITAIQGVLNEHN